MRCARRIAALVVLAAAAMVLVPGCLSGPQYVDAGGGDVELVKESGEVFGLLVKSSPDPSNWVTLYVPPERGLRGEVEGLEEHRRYRFYYMDAELEGEEFKELLTVETFPEGEDP